MRMTAKQQQEKTMKLERLLEPLGFECVGLCTFEHTASRLIFDFGAYELDLKSLIQGMLDMTRTRSFNRGHIEARKQIANFLNVEDDEENLKNAEDDGRLPYSVLTTL